MIEPPGLCVFTALTTEPFTRSLVTESTQDKSADFLFIYSFIILFKLSTYFYIANVTSGIISRHNSLDDVWINDDSDNDEW